MKLEKEEMNRLRFTHRAIINKPEPRRNHQLALTVLVCVLVVFLLVVKG